MKKIISNIFIILALGLGMVSHLTSCCNNCVYIQEVDYLTPFPIDKVNLLAPYNNDDSAIFVFYDQQSKCEIHTFDWEIISAAQAKDSDRGTFKDYLPEHAYKNICFRFPDSLTLDLRIAIQRGYSGTIKTPTCNNRIDITLFARKEGHQSKYERNETLYSCGYSLENNTSDFDAIFSQIPDTIWLKADTYEHPIACVVFGKGLYSFEDSESNTWELR